MMDQFGNALQALNPFSNAAGMASNAGMGALQQAGILGQAYQPSVGYSSPLPELIEKAIHASKQAGDYLAMVISNIREERDRLKLENDALRAEITRLQNFKEWFADGKEPQK